MFSSEDYNHLFLAIGFVLMVLINYASADRKFVAQQTDPTNATIRSEDAD